MPNTPYAAFLDSRRHLVGDHGFSPLWMPDFLFDFQRVLVDWALAKGRAAIFADCGLGKTPMQLVWAENVVRHTRRPVLILTPLAVGLQTIGEARKFGISAARAEHGHDGASILIANYERLHHFTPDHFAGVVCDESSILKSFDGARRSEVVRFLRKVPYRLLCTATAAPNDYIELGSSSEALGHMGHLDMLQRFFKNDQGNAVKTNRNWSGDKWRFKGHARIPFWKWVASWARALRRPSDFGYEDKGFILPALEYREHIVKPRRLADGMLFEMPAIGLREQREEAHRTIEERCEQAAALVAHDDAAVVWCHMNREAALLKKLIPDSENLSGADDLDRKEEVLGAFSSGKLRVLVTKPKIGAWGLNWQHCAHMVYFPSHSYEQYYQAVRRSWRFGQQRPVVVDIVTTPGGHNVMENLRRKAVAADAMFSELVQHMHAATTIRAADTAGSTVEVPAWALPSNS